MQSNRRSFFQMIVAAVGFAGVAFATPSKQDSHYTLRFFSTHKEERRIPIFMDPLDNGFRLRTGQHIQFVAELNGVYTIRLFHEDVDLGWIALSSDQESKLMWFTPNAGKEPYVGRAAFMNRGDIMNVETLQATLSHQTVAFVKTTANVSFATKEVLA